LFRSKLLSLVFSLLLLSTAAIPRNYIGISVGGVAATTTIVFPRVNKLLLLLLIMKKIQLVPSQWMPCRVGHLAHWCMDLMLWQTTTTTTTRVLMLVLRRATIDDGHGDHGND
jgi:ABC-type dipeptide/oligopeptide/nickel transport system permease component